MLEGCKVINTFHYRPKYIHADRHTDRLPVQAWLSLPIKLKPIIQINNNLQADVVAEVELPVTSFQSQVCLLTVLCFQTFAVPTQGHTRDSDDQLLTYQ